VELSNKVAVVTGAASGIGLALANKFAGLGARLLLADVDQAGLAQLVERLASEGVEVVGRRVDVSDPEAVEDLAAFAFERFGAVHLLCNNAGVAPAGRQRHIWEIPMEDWSWTLGVNLLGLLHGIHSFIPRMIEGGEPGHVVNTLSVAALTSGAASPPYAVSKHAGLRATEALYSSLQAIGAPIGVTALCPSVVNTRIFHAERSRPTELVPDGGIARERPELEAWYESKMQHGLAPEAVAEMVIEAIERQQFYLIPTQAFDEAIRHRAEAILARENPKFPNHLDVSRTDVERRESESTQAPR
jgi:NAD(P)-dependent dehydrogenase (short-subunit alcohol dehydrogenase family)